MVVVVVVEDVVVDDVVVVEVVVEDVVVDDVVVVEVVVVVVVEDVAATIVDVNDDDDVVAVANIHFENEYENAIYGKYVRFLVSMHPKISVTRKKLILNLVELIYEKQPLLEPISNVEKYIFEIVL